VKIYRYAKAKTLFIFITLFLSFPASIVPSSETSFYFPVYSGGFFHNPLEKFNFGKDYSVETELNIEGQIQLDLGYGFTFPLKKGITVGEGSYGIDRGLKYDMLEKLLIDGTIGDRIHFEFDYDSERTEEGLLEENNIYSVEYRGKEDEFLKEVTVGNKYLGVEGGRYVKVDEASPDSFALRALGGWDQLYFNALLRYDVGYEGVKVFKGNRRDVVDEVYDVDYIKSTYFFIPDKDIDPDSLRLYVSSTTTVDLTLDNKDFRLLIEGVDYDFDPSTGFVYFENSLASEDELVCYYTKDGQAVGSTSLGIGAIIGESGVRVDFNSNSFPQYFDSSGEFLYLKKRAFNSYWELRNAYPLPSYEGTGISSFEVRLLYTENSSPNSNYDDIIDQYSLDSERGVVFFNFTDDTGNFYPRPFPGVSPYSSPVTTENNPFDPDNPVYGGLSYPTVDKSINKLEFSYSFYTDTFFLDFNVIPGSVEIVVDGKVLKESDYEVDYSFGTVTFREGVVTPTSEIEIKYRYTSFGGGNKGLVGQFGVFYSNDFIDLKNLTLYRSPLRTQEAPELGAEGKRDIYNSTEIGFKIGANEDEEGAYFEAQAGVGLGLTNPNPHGRAIIDDMESSEAIFRVSNEAESWIIGSESQILENTGVQLTTRGDLLYKNYYKSTVLSGEVLEDLSWEIPQDQVFDYSEKAGPYNTSNHPDYSSENSLIMEYEIPDGGEDYYVTMVTPVGPEDFSVYDTFNILFKATEIEGGPVRLYVEFLKDYNEDLDGDGVLDGEKSVNDNGFVIVPLGGQQTKLGTDREGGSNGTLESEDINGNGVLDSSESGVIIPGPDGTQYLAEINTGETDWQTIAVPLHNIVQNYSDILQYVTAIRITLTGTGTSQPLNGLVLINRLWLSGSRIKNNSPDLLSVSEVSIDEDAEVYSNRFSESYPAIYEDLHGPQRYRSQTGHVEKTLVVRAIGDITTEASFSVLFGGQMDFSGYRDMKVYLYFPEGQSIPQNFSILIRIKSTDDQFLQAEIEDASFVAGWNEVSLQLFGEKKIYLNGTDAGLLIETAQLDVLKHVTEIKFIIYPDSGTIGSGFTMWVDEIHLANPENYKSVAYFTGAKLGYRGNLFSVMGFPIMGDCFLYGEYEKKSGSFSSGRGWSEKNTLLESGFSVAKALKIDASILWSEKRSDEKVDIEEFESPIESRRVISSSIEYSPESSWFPVVGHRYDFTEKGLSKMELEQFGFRDSILKEYENRFTLYTNYSPPFGLWTTWQLARGWIQRIEGKRTSSTPNILESTESGELEHSNRFSIGYGVESFSTSLGFSRDRDFLGSGVTNYSQWYDSYLKRFGDIFSKPSASLESAYLFSSTDSGSFNIEYIPEEVVGFTSSIGFTYSESNFIEDERIRDLLATSTLNIKIPVNIKLLKVTGSMDRYMTGDYKKFPYNKTEDEILFNLFKTILMPPLYYISPFPSLGRQKDYNAVNLFNYGDTKNKLYNKYNLDISLNRDVWFLPTNFGFSVYGQTERSSGSYTQMRGYEGRLEKLVDLKRGGGLYKKDIDFSLKYTHERDYTVRVLKNRFETSVKYQDLKEVDSGFVVDWNGSYQRGRQKRENTDLALIPDDPESSEEIPQKPWEDKLSSTVSVEWLWKIPVYRTFIFKLLPYQEKEYYFKNSEKITIENIYTFTDRELAGAFSNIPVRFTFQHRTDFSVSNSLSFYVAAKSVVGVEEKIVPPVEKGNLLPSAGFELDLGIKFMF